MGFLDELRAVVREPASTQRPALVDARGAIQHLLTLGQTPPSRWFDEAEVGYLLGHVEYLLDSWMPALSPEDTRAGAMAVLETAALRGRTLPRHPAPLSVALTKVGSHAVLPSRYAVELGLVVGGRATGAGEIFLSLRGRDALVFLLATEALRSAGPGDLYCASPEVLESLSRRPTGTVEVGSDHDAWPLFLKIAPDFDGRCVDLGLLALEEAPFGDVWSWEATHLGRAVLGEVLGEPASATVLLARGLSPAGRAGNDLEMAAVFAHRLHNALTPLSGDLDRLEDVVEGDAVRWVRRARRAVAELQAFADKAGQLAEHGEVHQIFDLAAALMESRDATAARRNGTTTVDVAAPEVVVRGPRHRFVECVAELITNACHAGARRVSLSVDVGESQVRLDVSDDGRGVADDVSDRLFERGFSGRASSGFGLAMARQTAERMGGSLALASTRPTCFRLALPIPGDDR